MKNKELIQRITDLLANELEEAEKADLRAAFAADADSRKAFESAQRIWQKLDSIKPKNRPAPRMSDELREALKSAGGKPIAERKASQKKKQDGGNSAFPTDPGKM